MYSNIDKEHFLLLYLYSDKLEEYINAIKKERSDNQGNELWYPMMLEYLKHWPYGEKYGCSTFEDMIRHFGHRQSLEMRIIREVIGDNAIIVPAKEWDIDEIMARIR